MTEPPKPPVSPAQPKVEYPADIDQYEHPYNYDNDLPDDADTQEEEDQIREQGF